MLVIALKDDHVSAWEAVYRGARDIGADFILGGSGHNAGVINPPAANKHGFWTGDGTARRAPTNGWQAPTGTRAAGGRSGPAGSTAMAAARRSPRAAIKDGIEPAPGSYVMMP